MWTRCKGKTYTLIHSKIGRGVIIIIIIIALETLKGVRILCELINHNNQWDDVKFTDRGIEITIHTMYNPTHYYTDYGCDDIEYNISPMIDSILNDLCK